MYRHAPTCLALLVACTAPEPEAPEPETFVFVSPSVGLRSYNLSSFDGAMTNLEPAHTRLSLTLFGPGGRIRRVDCDFRWAELIDTDNLKRIGDEHCHGNMEFRLMIRGATSMSQVAESGSLVVPLTERPTHALFEADQDGVPMIRKAGPIVWDDHETEYVYSGRLGFLRVE